jgi:hypothetical protein
VRPMDDGRALTPKEQYEAVVRQIEREEGLIHNRLSWMLAFQGFLFAARALVASGSAGTSAAAKSAATRDTFEVVLACLGIAIAALGLLGAIGAYWAMRNTCDFYWDRLSRGRSFMRPFGGRGAARLGKMPALGIPVATIGAWAWLLRYT